VFCIRHQPLLDFRPYQVGTSIPEEMSIPAGAPADIYETVLVYQKNGINKEFTENDFPWQDTTWKWVETRQTLVEKGYEPPIHDFSVTTEDGVDITDVILQDSNYTFLIIAPFLEKASSEGIQRMNDLTLKATDLGFSVYCLTSSAEDHIVSFKETFQPAFQVCTTDETTLKTIMRANPGLLLLREGTILGKWNFADIPEAEEIRTNLLSCLLDRNRKSQERSSVVILALGVILFFLLAIHFKADGS
jgi:hypothetical protein